MPPPFNGHGQKRQNNDRQNHQLEIVPHNGNIAEEESSGSEGNHPEDGADDVEDRKVAVAHASDARDERSEGTHDGNKARKNDGLSAVLFKERVGAHQVFVFEKTAARRERPRPDETSHGVIHGVTQNGRGAAEDDEDIQPQGAERGKGSRGEQEGIPRQEGGDHQTGFAEENDEQDAVGERAVRRNERPQRGVDVDDEIEEREECLHAGRNRTGNQRCSQ